MLGYRQRRYQLQEHLTEHTPLPEPNSPIHFKWLDPRLGLELHQGLMGSFSARSSSSSQV